MKSVPDLKQLGQNHWKRWKTRKHKQHIFYDDHENVFRLWLYIQMYRDDVQAL